MRRAVGRSSCARCVRCKAIVGARRLEVKADGDAWRRTCRTPHSARNPHGRGSECASAAPREARDAGTSSPQRRARFFVAGFAGGAVIFRPVQACRCPKAAAVASSRSGIVVAHVHEPHRAFHPDGRCTTLARRPLNATGGSTMSLDAACRRCGFLVRSARIADARLDRTVLARLGFAAASPVRSTCCKCWAAASTARSRRSWRVLDQPHQQATSQRSVAPMRGFTPPCNALVPRVRL